MRLTNYEEKQVEWYQIFVLAPIMVILIGLFFWVIIRAIDIHIENQDTMLCKSAQISRNVEYLEKCECYYQSGDIKCLQK